MVRGSIFSICSFAVCLRRILLVSLALTLVYLALSNFTFPANWHSSYVSSSTQYHFPIPEEIKLQNSEGEDKRPENASKSSRERRPEDLDYLLTDSSNLSGPMLESAMLELTRNETMPLCPVMGENPLLVGHIGQALLLIEELEEWEVEKVNRDLKPGGSWKPANCTSRHKVAIVVPYRDRKSHLVRLLDFLIPLLKKQMLDFRFIVTEQDGDDLFNKGRIMNAAFRYGKEQLGVDCLIFHDVDMFPQDDRTPYECPSHGPRHVGAFVSTLGYQWQMGWELRLWYQEIVGGVLAINTQDYVRVNGFSNSYWAWGGEDDDMGKRILSHNLTIDRPNGDFVRYSMLKHVKRKRVAPKLVYKLLEETEKRMDRDGLNEGDKWRLLKVDVRPLYFHLLVDVGDPPNEWKT